MFEEIEGSRIHRLLHRATIALRERSAPLLLRGVDWLGHGARVDGVPFVESFGAITIGDDFRLSSTPDQSHLVTGRDGVITIGDHVSIGPGAAIAAELRVTIGSGVQIGPYALIMDTDFHDVENMRERGGAARGHRGRRAHRRARDDPQGRPHRPGRVDRRGERGVARGPGRRVRGRRPGAREAVSSERVGQSPTIKTARRRRARVGWGPQKTTFFGAGRRVPPRDDQDKGVRP